MFIAHFVFKHHAQNYKYVKDTLLQLDLHIKTNWNCHIYIYIYKP